MINIFKATELLTSNLIYSYIMQSLCDQLGFDHAILLNNVSPKNDDLLIVDARGTLPSSMELTGLKPILDNLPKIAENVEIEHQLGSNYHNMIKFQSKPSYSYLLFSGLINQNDPSLKLLINQISYILEVKNAFDSLPVLTNSQSILKYQLNFFSSMINNIFEPYSLEMLINLDMEIISEMFLFPEALTLQLDGKVFRPACAKGVSLEKYNGFVLDAVPLLKNMNFRFFPTVLQECAAQGIGEDNYRLLNEAGARLMVPLSTGEQLDYIVICFSQQANSQIYYDKTSLASLCNILNRALEMQHVKSSLMISNLELNEKLQSLTALYRAAEVIFANTKINETLQFILDMIMENYQSSISSVFLHNFQDHRFEIMAIKSAYCNESLSYSLRAPGKTADSKRVIINYRDNLDERTAFLEDFPDFEKLEEQLKPCLVLQLLKGDVNYGFITLSDRVTGQCYSQNDQELLSLLINSISLAIQNIMIFGQLEDKSHELQQSLMNIYAIQDVLLIIKQARNLDNFLSLLSSALEMGVGVSEMSIFARKKNTLELLRGNSVLTANDLLAIQATNSPALINIDQNNIMKRCLVLPISHADYLKGYLLVESFKDTVIEDGEHIQLLSIIANIIGETFANLLEKQTIYPHNIIDFSKLILYKLQEQVDYLLDLGLEAMIVKFYDPCPHAIITSCREWAEGFIIYPQTGILISHLSDSEISQYLQPYNLKYRFIEMLDIAALYSKSED